MKSGAGFIWIGRRSRLLLSASLLGVFGATAADAQAVKHFDIPAEPVGQAIRAIAEQSGLQVLAPSEDIAGIQTNPLHGDYAPEDAVRRLFAGTGLQVVQAGASTFTIRRAADSASRDGDTTAVETVMVTGTRIKRAGSDTLEPALVTSGKELRQRGYTNILQALDETPGFAPSGVDPVGMNQSSFGEGQSFADFFGLGSQRTLTLVNGRRFVTSNTAGGGGAQTTSAGLQVDLNTIPVSLVDHVETVAIGGAPVYGADAIAGTINIVLKDHFNGVEVGGQYGITGHGDGESQSYHALVGGDIDDGRGNVVLSAEYDRQLPLMLSDRTGLHIALPDPTGGPPTESVASNIVVGALTEGGLPFLHVAPGYPIGLPGHPNDYIYDSGGTPLQFGKNGFEPFNIGPNLLGMPGVPLYNEGGDGMVYADRFTLVAPTTRVLLNGIAHYDLTSSVTFFMEANYANSQGEEMSDLEAFASPLLSGTAMSFSTDNAFLTPDERTTLIANGAPAGGTFQMARNFNDLLQYQGYLERNTVDLHRVVAGFKGSFNAWGNDWSWDASYEYGDSRATTVSSYIDDSRLQLAMDAVKDPVTGNIVCASGGSCVPINLFGENNFSKAAAQYVLDPTQAISENNETVATVNLSGNLPFGIAEPIAFNIGAEYRQEHGEFDPDATLQAGSSLFGLELVSPYQSISGSYSTREVYGETVVPLISDKEDLPVVKYMSFEGAIRSVDNSITGNAITWSAGGRLAPRISGWGDGLVFRGVFMHAIRSPAITELFSGVASSYGSISDPCGASLYKAGSNPAVRTANCTAALQAFGYASPADFHSTTTAISALGTISGNPDLKNETSNSYTLGFVYQPSLLPGFKFSADWSSINLTGGIQNLSINQVLDACYDSPNYPNDPACSATRFMRLPAANAGAGTANPVRVAGDIANGYSTGYINTSSIKFSGLIVTGEYAFNLGDLNDDWASAGGVNLGAKMFYTGRYDTVSFEGQNVLHLKGNVGTPAFSSQFNVDYAWDKLDVMVQGILISAVKNNTTLDSSVLSDHWNDVPAYWKFNGSVGYQITPELRGQLAVSNLLDRKLTDSQLYSDSYSTYDLIGRSFMISVTANY